MVRMFHFHAYFSLLTRIKATRGGGAGFEGTQQMFTAISRKVVGKTMHATIPKGNMGYDQCTFPGTVAVEIIYFCCFLLALANIRPWLLVPFFEIFLKKSELEITHNTFWDCHVHFFRQPFLK